jgi:hypothetical protein
MAYLDTDSGFSSPRLAPLPAAPQRASFSPLEWTVIMLAKGDSLASLRAPGRLSRALGGVLGLGAKSRLADPRLEALRRLSVHAWQRATRLPAAEVTRFFEAGFNAAQLSTLLRSITAAGPALAGARA